MTRNSSSLKAFLLLTLLSFALFLPGIFTLPMFDRDAAHFSQATRQMLETDNYFQIRYQDVTRFQKPPGINWLQALSVKAISHASSTWAAPYRIPSILGGLLAVLFTFAFAKRLIDFKTALTGATLLASTLLLNVESHMAVIDAMLLAAMVLMQGSLWVCYQQFKHNDESKPRPIGFIILFWLAMGAGIALKGTTPLIGLLTVIAVCITERNIRFLKFMRPLLGIFILLLSSSWLLLLNQAEHSNYLMEMIKKDLYPKLIGGHEGHGAPPGYYLLQLPITLWPASILLLPTALYAWHQRHRNTTKFLLCWILPNWLFYFLMPTKLPQYMLPMYPAITLLMALSLKHWASKNWSFATKQVWQLLLALWGVLGIGLAIACVLLPYELSQHISKPGVFAALAILTTSFLALHFSFTEQFNKLLLNLALGAVCSYFIIWQYLLPSMQDIWVSRNIARSVAHLQIISDTNPLRAIGYQEPSLVFEMGTRRVEFTSANTRLSNASKHSSRILLVNQANMPELKITAKKDHVTLNKLKTIKGFNYSKGKWVQLNLIEVSPKTQ